MSDKKNPLIELINSKDGMGMGITSSPSTTLEIVIDITEDGRNERILGQMVYVVLDDDGGKILVIGQIISIKTKNRWHEDLSFKGVIKHHGKLPHLSERADNRIAEISVQSCYDLSGDAPLEHILGNSPSTGVSVRKMENDVMDKLMSKHQSAITYIGKVYGTDVDLPFWFRHFGKTDQEEEGAKDAYHIGVFGKTGSGKTVTASMMLLGYAKNKGNMSILVLDPQGQFYNDKDLLPAEVKLEDQVKDNGMKYEKLNILSNVYLPGDNYELFGELLISNGFIQEAFRPLYSQEKVESAAQAVVEYLIGRSEKPSFNLSSISSPRELLEKLLARFLRVEKDKDFSKYVTMIFGTVKTQERLRSRVDDLSRRLGSNVSVLEKWESALNLFSKGEDRNKQSVDEIVKKVVDQKGNFLILNLRPEKEDAMNENLPALFIKIIEEKIVQAGSEKYAKRESANCLIVMDEAHRFISKGSTDERVKELTREITNSVRTTRKYGIGYMFITQTIESLDNEILSQMRIFAFGHGLTSSSEARKVSEIINNKASMELYKSFIDPSSNDRFPFMFFGPISPLSFTGSPLFLEVYTKFEEYKKKNE